MPSPLDALDRYLVITADTHAGASPELYGPYLDSQWQSDYEQWLVQSAEDAEIMRKAMGTRSIGVDGDMQIFGYRNWDSAKRLKETEADGVVGEIVFPNTSPPFAPTMFSELGEAELGDDRAKRWAGIQAHNRWLADFCKEAPGRRAGIAQIFLPFVEESVEEIRWAKANGLTGGVLLPGAPPGSGVDPLYASKYEPIFAVCAELGMPLNHHAGGATPDFGPHYPQSLAMYMLEVTWWAHRALWHLMFTGVFERHPNLQFVLTETGTDWAPRVLGELDHFFRQMRDNEQCSEYKFGRGSVEQMSLMPSEYFERQCHLGASFMTPQSCAKRDEVGVHKLMWGSDYPHIEGSYPFTREHLRLTFAGVPEDEIQQIVGLNAARVYGFDVEALAPVAARIGPAKAEIAEPLDYAEVPELARKCPAFAPDSQQPAA